VFVNNSQNYRGCIGIAILSNFIFSNLRQNTTVTSDISKQEKIRQLVMSFSLSLFRLRLQAPAMCVGYPSEHYYTL